MEPNISTPVHMDRTYYTRYFEPAESKSTISFSSIVLIVSKKKTVSQWFENQMICAVHVRGVYEIRFYSVIIIIGSNSILQMFNP